MGPMVLAEAEQIANEKMMTAEATVPGPFLFCKRI